MRTLHDMTVLDLTSLLLEHYLPITTTISFFVYFFFSKQSEIHYQSTNLIALHSELSFTFPLPSLHQDQPAVFFNKF